MDLSTIFTPQVISQGGFAGVVVFFCIKAIIKLYGDMRDDRKSVDEGITTVLKTVSTVLEGVVKNLDTLTTRVDKLNERVCNIEKEFWGGDEIVRAGVGGDR